MKHLNLYFFITVSYLFSFHLINAERIGIIGCGYVGLITGAGLAEKCGHHVTCADINEERVSKLQQGIMPIYEKNLKELTLKNLQAGLLHFSSDVEKVIQESDIIFIAVWTPMDEDGTADLSAVRAVLKTIAKNLTSYKIIVMKSTVPIGTHNEIEEIMRTYAPIDAAYDIVSNPEFLRQGSAFEDFFNRNPIIIGCDSDSALERMEQVYEPLRSETIHIIKTDNATAEMVKYAHNCFLATRVTFVNELALLCNAANADILQAIHIMSEGERMCPTSKLRPGPGIGGSCLPKDTNALVMNAKRYGVDLTLIRTAINSNDRHKQKMIEYIEDLLGDFNEPKTIGILGLSFKAGTDDIRYSVALPIIDYFQSAGCIIKAYDPQAMVHVKKMFPNATYCSHAHEVLVDTDIVVILTEWDEFKHIDFKTYGDMMKQKIIFDTRNMYNPKKLTDLGFTVKNLGRRR